MENKNQPPLGSPPGPPTNLDPPPNNSTVVGSPIADQVEPPTTGKVATQPNFQPSTVHPAVIQSSKQSGSAGDAASPVDITPVGNTFLTGSQISQEKKKLPRGMYIIIGFTSLGFVAGLFDSSQASIVYTIVMLVDLLLAVGLILRLEIARKLMVGLSSVLVAITLVSIVLLYGLQQRVQQLKTNYDNAVSRIDQARLTTTQKQQLEAMSTTLAEKEKQTGKAITFTYLKLGLTTVEAVAVIVYLTRPKVKEVFYELEA